MHNIGMSMHTADRKHICYVCTRPAVRTASVFHFCITHNIYYGLLAGVGSILVHDTFRTKGGRFWYISISVQSRSRLVHGNSAYATSVHRQYNFSTQSVQQEYDFGTRLRTSERRLYRH